MKLKTLMKLLRLAYCLGWARGRAGTFATVKYAIEFAEREMDEIGAASDMGYVLAEAVKEVDESVMV